MNKKFGYLLLILGVFFGPAKALAQYGLWETAEKLGYQQTTSVYDIIGTSVSTGLSLIAIAFFAMMMYAGIRWMTARGKEELSEKAIHALQAASIGFIIAVLSYALTVFIFGRITAGKEQTTAPAVTTGGPATGKPSGLTDAECNGKGGKCDYVANVTAKCNAPDFYNGSTGDSCTPNGSEARVCCVVANSADRCAIMGGVCGPTRCGDINKVDMGYQCDVLPGGEIGPTQNPYCCRESKK